MRSSDTMVPAAVCATPAGIFCGHRVNDEDPAQLLAPNGGHLSYCLGTMRGVAFLITAGFIVVAQAAPITILPNGGLTRKSFSGNGQFLLFTKSIYDVGTQLTTPLSGAGIRPPPTTTLTYPPMDKRCSAPITEIRAGRTMPAALSGLPQFSASSDLPALSTLLT